MANVLNGYKQNAISKADYFETLKIYTKSHRLKREDGRVVPWIDENLNPYTGDWIARTRLAPAVRGRDYNHSSYCDLIISGLIGLRPRPDDVVEVNPLVPADTWDWFCLDNVLYHGHFITILWDKTGRRYGKGIGLIIFADGSEIARSDVLARVTAQLPATKKKQPAQPAETAKQDLQSKIGNLLTDINRPVLLRRSDDYHIWYTGQASGHSWIGYATSSDGKTWKRMSSKPVLREEEPWEKVAVMCPPPCLLSKTERGRANNTSPMPSAMQQVQTALTGPG
jgi:hypothetical protein